MPLNNAFTRRAALGLLAGSATVLALPRVALALTAQQATSLVQSLSDEVMAIVNSGRSEAQVLSQFEQIFNRYADVMVIARSVLGAPWRQATNAQKSAFVTAFRGYAARKYGKQFRQFRGATISVNRASDQGNKGVLVQSTVNRPGAAPYAVDWQVSDRSGSGKLINLYIEGISMLSTERSEVQAILSSKRNDIDALIADLNRRG